jgi:hypothetical protein
VFGYGIHQAKTGQSLAGGHFDLDSANVTDFYRPAEQAHVPRTTPDSTADNSILLSHKKPGHRRPEDAPAENNPVPGQHSPSNGFPSAPNGLVRAILDYRFQSPDALSFRADLTKVFLDSKAENQKRYFSGNGVILESGRK